MLRLVLKQAVRGAGVRAVAPRAGARAASTTVLSDILAAGDLDDAAKARVLRPDGSAEAEAAASAELGREVQVAGCVPPKSLSGPGGQYAMTLYEERFLDENLFRAYAEASQLVEVLRTTEGAATLMNLNSDPTLVWAARVNKLLGGAEGAAVLAEVDGGDIVSAADDSVWVHSSGVDVAVGDDVPVLKLDLGDDKVDADAAALLAAASAESGAVAPSAEEMVAALSEAAPALSAAADAAVAAANAEEGGEEGGAAEAGGANVQEAAFAEGELLVDRMRKQAASVQAMREALVAAFSAPDAADLGAKVAAAVGGDADVKAAAEELRTKLTAAGEWPAAAEDLAEAFLSPGDDVGADDAGVEGAAVAESDADADRVADLLGVKPAVADLLLVMGEAGDLRHLPEALSGFRSLVKELLGVEEVVVRAPETLSADVLAAVEARVQPLVGDKDISLSFVVDDSVRTGFVVAMENGDELDFGSSGRAGDLEERLRAVRL